ncbi:hypothetical protein IM774_04795 [Erysipelotrichaceae bacterium RD49]|nr:hypothetical protein [Erysipelotrichaceae bacterium RD49]
MTPSQINDRFEHGKQDEKHLCRLYLFAGASGGISDAFLDGLQSGICKKLHLDRAGFYQAMQQASSLWQQKVDQAVIQAGSLELIRTFEKSRAQAYRQHGIAPAKARVIICTRFVLILENLSILTGKNYLKPGRMKAFNDLLHHPSGLGPYAKWLFYPALKASQGKWRLTEEKFVFTSLYLNRLFADYLYAGLNHNPALQQIILEAISQTKSLKLHEIKRFLQPAPAWLDVKEAAFKIADQPLEGLDPMMEDASFEGENDDPASSDGKPARTIL